MRTGPHLGALALAAATLTSDAALACGGFFCAQQPVVQTNERIVFVDHADGRMSMVVEVQYSGTAAAFAWVLPVAGVPTVGVSSTNALNALSAATRPRFVVTSEGNACVFDFPTNGGSQDAGAFSDASVGGGVTVLDAGHVGPYDYVVIQVDSALPNPADAGRVFLEQNGFDVSAVGADILSAYLAGGDNLLAFRLQKDANVGAIRPVVLTYDSRVPVIPIRPTAVAAQAGLPIEVYLYGGSRAVSSSYDMITIPDAAIDWRFPASSYASILPRAIDEAGGHAFVTEFAGPSPQLGLDAASARADFASLAANASTDAELLLGVLTRFAAFDGLSYALARNDVQLAPRWQPPSPDTFCTSFPLAQCVVVGSAFDRTAFLADLENHVVAPYEATEQLLGARPYVTRVITELDPGEMDLDPVFAFALGLPDVSNVHRATLSTQCVTGFFNAQYARLASGRYVSYLEPAGDAVPIVETRIDYDPLGQSTVVWDRTADVLAGTLETPPRMPTAGTRGGAGGCAAGGGRTSGMPALLGVVALALAAHRRRGGNARSEVARESTTAR